MVNETAKNMELIIMEMGMQVKEYSENFNALKTLSNSYHTLLRQLFMNPYELKDIENMNILEIQQTDLIKLKNHLDTKSIPELLKEGRYRDVNHITTTTSKLYDSIRDLSDLLNNYVYQFHRKTVAVISFDINRAITMMNKLVEKNGEEIIKTERSFNNTVIKTKSFTFSAYKYSDRLQGHRFNEVYVENDFKYNKEVEVESLVKDKNNITYFELR